MTDVKTPVYYRLDRIEGDQLMFNMGARTERRDGRVVSIRTPSRSGSSASSETSGLSACGL